MNVHDIGCVSCKGNMEYVPIMLKYNRSQFGNVVDCEVYNITNWGDMLLACKKCPRSYNGRDTIECDTKYENDVKKWTRK